MEWLQLASQVVIALGLLNVWLLRAGKATAWRGGQANNMSGEQGSTSWPLEAARRNTSLREGVSHLLRVSAFKWGIYVVALLS